ncbi:hypothetical protein PV328_003255 [Microctonus aethiopoides]|uniref:Uncharacterized protein n=1 Tax=Microctonus aethiopoides TaxID=144406 RepID=A0AA39F817_9HYME|nr:hypothetical protein PV328_003255 [Microctonus aethiopoides]
MLEQWIVLIVPNVQDHHLCSDCLHHHDHLFLLKEHFVPKHFQLKLKTAVLFLFLARTCLNAFGFSRLWQCLLTCCHLSVEGPAASLIHAPLKEPDESSRRDFSSHHPHLRHYRRYAVHQQTDASTRAIHMYPPISPEYEQVHHDQAPISNNIPITEEAITRNKSPSGRRSTQGGTEHVIMLLSVAAQITHKKPRFL